MGIFGESKQDIINRYENLLESKQLEIDQLEKEIMSLRNVNQSLSEDVTREKNKLEQCDKKSENVILSAGRYRGGIDIPIGVYNLTIVSGTGIIETQKPDKLFFRLESNENIRKERNWNDTYSGLFITDETILDISESAKIEFELSKPISYDREYEKYIIKRDAIKKEIEYLKKIRDYEKVKVGDVFTLKQGTYYGGKTIPVGIYNLKAISESSMVETNKPKVWFNIGTDEDYFDKEYIGLEIGEDTILKINSKCEIEFCLTIKSDSQDKIVKKKQELDKLNQEIEDAIKLLNNVNSKIRQREIEDGTITLGAGKYKGGCDISIGKYDLELLSGVGDFEINKPEDIYFRMTKNYADQEQYGWIDEYKNLEISENSRIKISESAKIKFIKKSDYSYECEKQELDDEYKKKKQELDFEYNKKYSEYLEQFNKMQSEIESLKKEIKILNSKAIEKYYVFSDYDGVTSQECKNRLLLLKAQEKSMHETEEDIVILNNVKPKKLTDRSIRQILRNFNADCDNQIMNIRIKNIDMVRNRIQKSYDTLNKLYSVDGIALSENILSLKLEQATLLYTYELKYQQEKDIQQAIKEQMLEEAKAEREIQEQKKRIEKDLQQHLGEVNRLMKYLQKSQIDAERQLYMDKIKGLEDKIKSLEADKETVLKREANAKAGFVYIISNIGSFGENIYKIGMTRRLEPMDRINELSSASVPFEFDVHAMIFSSDAPELETMLHQHFADKAVNKVNPRKEFYKVDIDEIEKLVKKNYNNTVQFTKIPIAAEYRQSLELEKGEEF